MLSICSLQIRMNVEGWLDPDPYKISLVLHTAMVDLLSAFRYHPKLAELTFVLYWEIRQHRYSSTSERQWRSNWTTVADELSSPSSFLSLSQINIIFNTLGRGRSDSQTVIDVITNELKQMFVFPERNITLRIVK